MGRQSILSRAWLWGVVAAVGVAGCKPTPPQLQMDPTRAYVDARTKLLQAAEDPDPRVRTHALEALASTEGVAAGPVLLQALRDDRLPVVSAAAMAAGETRYAPAMPFMLELAKNPKTPPKLMCVVIYALHRLGNDTYTTRLADLLQDRDKFVRAEAARVMGKMGEPSAIPLLKGRQGDDLEVVVRLSITEALALLGDDRSLALLEAFTKSQFVEDRLIAVAAMGRLRHQRSVYVLKRITRDRSQGPLVQVASAGALARLGEPVNATLAEQAVQDPERVLEKARGRSATVQQAEITSLQTLALLALERMGDTAAVDMIHPLLGSKRGAVRVAAARAILRLLRGHRAPPPAVEPAQKQPPPVPQTQTKPSRPALHIRGGKD